MKPRNTIPRDPLDGLSIPARRALEAAALGLLMRCESDGRFVRACAPNGPRFARADVEALDDRGYVRNLGLDFRQITAAGRRAAEAAKARRARFERAYGKMQGKTNS